MTLNGDKKVWAARFIDDLFDRGNEAVSNGMADLNLGITWEDEPPDRYFEIQNELREELYHAALRFACRYKRYPTAQKPPA